MSTTRPLTGPCMQCFRQTTRAWATPRLRSFSTSITCLDNVQEQDASSPAQAPLDPSMISSKRDERRAIRSGLQLVGSRRRRAALSSSQNIPFEKLPYQCFQEARKILQADREEKLQKIQVMRARIDRLLNQDPSISGGEEAKQRRLLSMRTALEELKILADINDPLVKKRFEDGKGDLNKPIYRHLADKQWRSYKRLVIMQRVTQMHVIPDLLPTINPVTDVTMSFGRRNIQPGQFVDSRITEVPPRLHIQAFDKGERHVTLAVIDADVPMIEEDGFSTRCHFLASNIPISPTSGTVNLEKLSQDNQVGLSWLPPFAQKGSPYHRLVVLVLQQKQEMLVDVASIREGTQRDGFNIRSLIAKHSLMPVGVQMFRNKWDEGTLDVMRRAGVEGADIEFRRKRVEPLPYKKKDGARYR